MIDDSLIDMIKGLNRLQEIKLRIVVDEVYNIISNNIVDDDRTEHLFDDILDLYFWYGDKIEYLFYELYDYYININKEIATDYKGFYLELSKEE